MRCNWSLNEKQQASLNALLGVFVKVWLWTHDLLYGKQRFWVKHRQRCERVVLSLSLLAWGYQIFAAATSFDRRFVSLPALIAALGFFFVQGVIMWVVWVLTEIHDAAKWLVWHYDFIPRALHTARAAQSAWEAWEEESETSSAPEYGAAAA